MFRANHIGVRRREVHRPRDSADHAKIEQEPTLIRAIIAVVAGVIVWGAVAVGLDLLLRIIFPGYAAAEPEFRFTLGMMLARLALPGAVPSIAAGFVSAWIARGEVRVVAVLAIILLLCFLPGHYHLWTKFPLWYHLTFFVSLILLPLLGAKLKSGLIKS
jgi:hypothetical protein